MPRRCRGIRGDVGIAPYGTTIDRQCVRAGFYPARSIVQYRREG